MTKGNNSVDISGNKADGNADSVADSVADRAADRANSSRKCQVIVYNEDGIACLEEGVFRWRAKPQKPGVPAGAGTGAGSCAGAAAGAAAGASDAKRQDWRGFSVRFPYDGDKIDVTAASPDDVIYIRQGTVRIRAEYHKGYNTICRIQDGRMSGEMSIRTEDIIIDYVAGSRIFLEIKYKSGKDSLSIRMRIDLM